jgi:hypothetical protein
MYMELPRNLDFIINYPANSACITLLFQINQFFKTIFWIKIMERRKNLQYNIYLHIIK